MAVGSESGRGECMRCITIGRHAQSAAFHLSMGQVVSRDPACAALFPTGRTRR